MWVILALPDPEPNSESGNESTDLIESGSNPDPNPTQDFYPKVWSVRTV